MGGRRQSRWHVQVWLVQHCIMVVTSLLLPVVKLSTCLMHHSYLSASTQPMVTAQSVPVHRFEFRYKQSITTSDNFLGMSGKDPSSTCCEHLVLVVQLPHATTAAGEDVAVMAMIQITVRSCRQQRPRLPTSQLGGRPLAGYNHSVVHAPLLPELGA